MNLGNTSMQLTIFSELQIHTELDGAIDDVVGPCGEEHVTNGSSGNQQSGDDLGQVVCRDTVAKARVQHDALGG